jgi:hypothetical protein
MRALLLVALALSPFAARAGEVACPPPRHPPSADAQISRGCVGELAWLPHRYFAAASTVPYSRVEEKLGPPLRSWPGPERYKGEYSVIFHEFRKDGLRLVASEVGSDLLRIEEFYATRSGFQLPCGLEFGQDRARVKSALGDAAGRGGHAGHTGIEALAHREWCEDAGGYVARYGSRSVIRFGFDDRNRLNRISWEYFSD